jgi:prepilin-type N-terminal cleavage/methylation domain-containing protein
MQYYSTFKSGMTLVETIVVVSISTILMLAITSSIQYFYQINGYQMAQTSEVTQVRQALKRWLRDVREMTFAADGTYPLALAGEHEIGFYVDIDADPAVEYVRYRIDGSNTLIREEWSPSGFPPVYDLATTSERTFVISEYVHNLTEATTTFRYYDEAGTYITNPNARLSDVRYIEINLIVNVDPGRAPGEFLLRSGVGPRNLRDYE